MRKIKYLGISQFGIHFNYYGDEIIFLWPWKWQIEKGKLYYLFSCDFCCGFYSFKKYKKLLFGYIGIR